MAAYAIPLARPIQSNDNADYRLRVVVQLVAMTEKLLA
jgi:hypothetical protein